MTTEEAVSWGTEGLLFNAKDGFLEGIVRGCRAGLLTPADYANLAQCETLDDVKLHLCGTDYAGVIQNEPSPLHPSTIVARCTRKIVDDFEMMRCQASEPLATFLDYLTYGHMIDNVVLMVTGALHERDTQELLEKCHPLGMFDSMATLSIATSPAELYRMVLVDTPLGPYFGDCLSLDDLDEMNIEIIRNTLYKAYLEDFYTFCQGIGGSTAEVMHDILTLEADRRAINITVNSLDTDHDGQIDYNELEKLMRHSLKSFPILEPLPLAPLLLPPPLPSSPVPWLTSSPPLPCFSSASCSSSASPSLSLTN